MENKKQFIKDYLYSFSGIIILNVVLQLIIYPMISKSLGSKDFGVLLTLLSFSTAFATTLGYSANCARVIKHSQKKDSNGDYNIYLLISNIIAVSYTVIVLKLMNKQEWIYGFLFYILVICSNLRFYVECNNRMDVDYKKYFGYCISMTIGYVVGFLQYYFTKNVLLLFILGEIFPIIFMKKVGVILDKPYFKVGEFFKENFKYIWIFTIINFIGAIISFSDKFIIYKCIGELEVTLFYVSTLIGKSISIITGPLESVLLGHIVKKYSYLSKKLFLKIIWLILLITVCLCIFSNFASNIIVKLLYSNIYEEAKKYFFIGNCGQILYLMSSLIIVVLLKFISEKKQIFFNAIYLILYLSTFIFSSIKFGFYGAIISLLILNLIRFILIVIIGVFSLKNKECGG